MFVLFRYTVSTKKKRFINIGGIHKALSVVCAGSAPQELEQNWDELTAIVGGKDLSPYPVIHYRASAGQYRVLVDDHLGWETDSIFTAIDMVVKMVYVYSLEYASAVAPFWEAIHHLWYDLPLNIATQELTNFIYSVNKGVKTAKAVASSAASAAAANAASS